MSEVFTSKTVNVQQGMDIVQLVLGTHKIRLYYQTVFAITRGMRVAAKEAIRRDGSPAAAWRELAVREASNAVPCHHEYRRSGATSNVKNYSVSFENTLVVLKLDELTAKFHYSDATFLQHWLRTAAKQAKNWAGDKTRALTACAHLSNAQDNHRYG